MRDVDSETTSQFYITEMREDIPVVKNFVLPPMVVKS